MWWKPNAGSLQKTISWQNSPAQAGEYTFQSCGRQAWPSHSSTAEYCAEVWENSYHTQNTELKNSCKVVNGSLRQKTLPSLYRLAGIVTPEIQRSCNAKIQNYKQETDNIHPVYEYSQPSSRLKSGKSFMRNESMGPRAACISLLASQMAWKGPKPDKNCSQIPN